ncbi:retrovirus-related pol polyprotein from transposon TNT 1-94 [Tanacetum coccineum]
MSHSAGVLPAPWKHNSNNPSPCDLIFGISGTFEDTVHDDDAVIVDVEVVVVVTVIDIFVFYWLSSLTFYCFPRFLEGLPEACSTSSRAMLIDSCKSQSPKFLFHPLDFSCWAVFSGHHSFHVAPGDLISISKSQSLNISVLPVPPVFVDPDPPVLFESALVFSYFSMALATQVHSWLRICKGMQSYGTCLLECDCLAQKLSEQTDFVSKEIYTELLQRFARLEKHSISLEIALQECQVQLKNDTVCKERASNVFRKEREQYVEIQDLKAQLQDKNIAISELKKLIEKCKGKSVDTKFDKPSIVRQPNAQRIPKPSVLGKPAPFSDSLERKYFAKKKSVPKTNESEGLSKPVTLQNLPKTAMQAVRNTNVIKPGMYRIASSTTQTRAPQLNQTFRNTNPRASTSTGVAHKTNVSRPQPRSNQMKDKVLPNTSQVKFKKTEVEDHPRISSISNQTKSVTACNDNLNSRTSNVNAVCATCGKCVFNSNHDACVSKFLKDVNARTKKPNVVPISTRKPKSQANKSVATPHKKIVASESTITNSKSYYRMLYKKTNKAWKWWIAQQCPSAYTWVPKTKRKWVPKVRNESVTKKIVQLILFIVDSGCTKHMTGNLSLLCNFMEKYLGTVRFGNDQFALILGYGDLVQGNITIKRVYYVEGLNHNLFSVGQFCDADLEVAFRKSMCFVRDLQGNDLLTGNRGTDLYTISLQETTSSTPSVYVKHPPLSMVMASKTFHLKLYLHQLVFKEECEIGLPKLKYVKDQLCSSCEVSKAKRSSFKSKTVPSSKGRLNLLHMDLCGPMRVASINGKKYILVIVDDYSRYTWTLFLRSKDETPEVLKDFLTMIQRNLQALVISVRTDRGTEFLNKTLNAFFKEEGIEHQTSTP